MSRGRTDTTVVASKNAGGGRDERRSIPRLVVVGLTLGIYFVLSPFGYAFFALVSFLPTRRPLRRAARLQRLMSAAFALMHHWLRAVGLLRFDPRRLRGQLPDEPCVIVSNHITLTDVTAVVASVGEACILIKTRIYDQWWCRRLLASAGHVETGFGTPESGRRVLETSVQRLGEGWNVLVFPEGGRAPVGQLAPFGRSAFEIASRARVPVVPLVVRCQPPWLSKRLPLLRPPVAEPRMHIEVQPRIDPADYGYDSRALRSAVRNLYEELTSETPRIAANDATPSDVAPFTEGAADGRRARDRAEASDRRLADAGGRRAEGHR